MTFNIHSNIYSDSCKYLEIDICIAIIMFDLFYDLKNIISSNKALA